MKFHIDQRESGLQVRIEDAAGNEEALVGAIRRCRQSAWACPSGECMNIADISERVEAGRVSLTLIPRPGAQLDPSGIEHCLRYMLAAFR